MSKYFIILLCISACLSSCYSFKGISIPDNVDTFSVALFQNRAGNAPATIGQSFTDELIDKINNQTRLNFDASNPDIEFRGSISGYDVQSIAPTRDNTSALNRLKIRVAIEYINHNNEEDNWKQTFSQQRDFGSGENLFSVQDQYIAEIFELIVEDVFNKAFTNW
jgi:TolB-like protein